ncbi:MAG TPA: signal peptidase II [Thermohalobaculum sp.]|nr:signal peptidase II [Thermohalobaculum sp.]
MPSPSGSTRSEAILTVPSAKLTIRSRMLIAGGVVFAIDRMSKWWIVEWLDLANIGRVEVVPPYLNFVMAWNRGINFGLFGGGSVWVLIILSIAISVALIWWVYRQAGHEEGKARVPILAWGAGIVVGGALGNAWDRLQYGAVADFLNMSCCGFNNPYAFNIADVAIFAGAALIAFRA